MLQAAALDCGPAALACLLCGFGMELSFEKLRDACRTGRDGTSIDALEDVAIEQGLEAEQVLVPVEYLTLAEAACLPCILVVARPGGAAHFVTVWRLHGRRVQVIDPAIGRRWPTRAALERESYRHRALVPAAAWRAWAVSDEALRPLAARLAVLGISAQQRQALIESAATASGWRPLAAVDAATRFTCQLMVAGAVRRGAEASRWLRSLLDSARAPAAQQDGGGVLPAECWTVWPAAPDAEGGGRVLCEGAVLVRVRGRRSDFARRRPLLVRGDCPRFAERGGVRPSPGAARLGRMRSLLRVPSWTGIGAILALAAVGAAFGRFAEAALLVAALEMLSAAASRNLRAAVLAGLLLLGAAVLLCEVTAAGAAQALGRRRETGLRLRLAAKLPRLADRYLRTRLLGDLAERAHRISDLRRGPELAAAALAAGLDASLATVGIVWLDPALAIGAVAAGLGAAAVPLLLLPRCEERSHRVSGHGAALGALYLDVLRGLAAVRAHGAETVFRRRHDELLAGWLRARREAGAAAAWLETGVQGLLSLAVSGLVLGHVRRQGLDPQTMVLALWAFQLLGAGQRLALLAGRSLPLDRSLRRRIEEPLAAAEDLAREEVPEHSGEGRQAQAAGQVLRHAKVDAEKRARGVAAEESLTEMEAGARPGRTAGANLGYEEEVLGPDAAAIVARTGRRHAARRISRPAGPASVLGMAIAWEGCTVECEGRPLLRELELEVPRGQHVALLGSSGAGKSTLLGTLLGWHWPAAGCLRIDGRRVDAAVVAEVRRATAWVAPEVSLWRASLLANLAGGWTEEEAGDGAAGATPGKAGVLAPVEALREAQLLDLVPELVRGMQEPLGEGGSRLSGGEAQRLRLARALLREGVRLALLDEAFRGLAADQRGDLLAVARWRWRRATLLYVTHSPREAAGFDRVVILEEGRLVEDGPPAVLAGRDGSRYRAILDAELRAAEALAAPRWRHLHLAAGQLQETAAGGERGAAERQVAARQGGRGAVDTALAGAASDAHERNG